MFERMFNSSIVVAILSVAAFIGCMIIYEPIARIFLGISATLIGFFALCWADKFILKKVDLYEELIIKQNVALAIVIAAFVYLLGCGFSIIS